MIYWCNYIFIDSNFLLFSNLDLPKYTDMTMSTVTQRQSVFYSGSFPLLRFVVSQLAGDVHLVDDRDGSEKRVTSFCQLYFDKSALNFELKCHNWWIKFEGFTTLMSGIHLILTLQCYIQIFLNLKIDSRKFSIQVIRAFGAVDVVHDKRMVTIEWVASPVNDMYADAVLSAILQVTIRCNDD